MTRHANPAGLGIVPLLAWAAGAAAVSWFVNREWDRQDNAAAYIAALPSPGTPPAAAAPQTREEMTGGSAWSIERLYQRTAEATREAGAALIPDTPDNRSARATDTALLWAAAGLGAVSLYLLWRK